MHSSMQIDSAFMVPAVDERVSWLARMMRQADNVLQVMLDGRFCQPKDGEVITLCSQGSPWFFACPTSR